jgi:hypothetical protein
MMRQLIDARMLGGNVDTALDAARSVMIEQCARDGGQPGNIEVWPLVGGYAATIHWTIAGRAGGRAGRNRRQKMTIELIPPAASDE